MITNDLRRFPEPAESGNYDFTQHAGRILVDTFTTIMTTTGSQLLVYSKHVPPYSTDDVGWQLALFCCKVRSIEILVYYTVYLNTSFSHAIYA